MADPLKAIRDALDAGNKQEAQVLLRPLLGSEFVSAEVYYLAARASNGVDKAIQYLQKSLEIDASFPSARAALLKLQDHVTDAPTPQVTPAPKVMLPKKPQKTVKANLREDNRRMWTQIGCLFSILLSLSMSYFVMNVLGLAAAGELNGLFTGIRPIQEIDGTPVEYRVDAPLVVTASASRPVQSEEPIGDTLLPGFAHEYRFAATAGEEVAIMVQFISPTAKSVQRNVAVMTPNGQDASSVCERGQILQDNSGVTFICNISQTGEWKIRMFGRENESSGAYVVAVERMPPIQ